MVLENTFMLSVCQNIKIFLERQNIFYWILYKTQNVAKAEPSSTVLLLNLVDRLSDDQDDRMNYVVLEVKRSCSAINTKYT